MSMLFKRIKDWATSITAFRTGDVIPVDGPSGTAKMAKDALLNETFNHSEQQNFCATRQELTEETSRATARENEIESLFVQPTEEAVALWLAAHPEVTTTVQDGSLTEPKFSEALKLKTIKDDVTPEMFGAVGDGETDDSVAFIELFKHHNIYIPAHTYKIARQIPVYSDTCVIGASGSCIDIQCLGKVFVNATQQIDNIVIENLEIKAPYQKNNVQDDNYIVYFDDVVNLTVENCNIHDCYSGIRTARSKNVLIKNNVIHHNTWWGVVIGTSTEDVSNVILTGNISHDNTADGLKMTGYIEHILVEGNISYDNGQDGFDFAGHSCKDVLIAGNAFYNNADCGITFKCLYNNEYPFVENKPRYWEQVRIVNNNLAYNLYGINCQNYYDDYAQHVHILIDGNLIRGRYYNPDSTWLTSYGIKLGCAAFDDEDSIVISHNDLFDVTTVGIRLIDARNVTVRGNRIIDNSGHLLTAIRVDWIANQLGDRDESVLKIPFKFDNLKFIENTIELTRTNAQCITEDNAADMITLNKNTSNWIIKGNKCKWNNADAYAVWLTANSGAIVDNEYTGEFYTESPVGRGTKNFIYRSTNPKLSKCIGWMCVEQGSSATFRAFGETAKYYRTYALPDFSSSAPNLTGQANDTNLGSTLLSSSVVVFAGEIARLHVDLHGVASYIAKVAASSNGSWGIAVKFYNDTAGYDAFNYTIGEGYFVDKFISNDFVKPNIGDTQVTFISGSNDIIIDNRNGNSTIELNRISLRTLGTMLDVDSSHTSRLSVSFPNASVRLELQ